MDYFEICNDFEKQEILIINEYTFNKFRPIIQLSQLILRIKLYY